MPFHSNDWLSYQTPLHENDLGAPVAQWQYSVCHHDHGEQRYPALSVLVNSPTPSTTYTNNKWKIIYLTIKHLWNYMVCMNSQFYQIFLVSPEMSSAHIALCGLTSISYVFQWEMEGPQWMVYSQSALPLAVFSSFSRLIDFFQANHNPHEIVCGGSHCIFVSLMPFS